MAILKIINNPVDTLEALYNLCQYIIDPQKTENGRYVGSRGISVDNAYEEILEMQNLFQKTSGRKGYHIAVSFSEEAPLTAYDIMQIAYEISSIFFPRYQVLYGVNMVKTHPHIHFLINTVSLIDGVKLHIGFAEIKVLRALINQIESDFI